MKSRVTTYQRALILFLFIGLALGAVNAQPTVDAAISDSGALLAQADNQDNFTYQFQTTEVAASFEPDNGDVSTPTLVSIGQVFTISFAGELFTYVQSIPENNIKISEAYLQNCFELTDTDRGLLVDFSVAIVSGSGEPTVVTITPTEELEDGTRFTLSILDDKLQIGQGNSQPLGNSDFHNDIYAENAYITQDLSAPVLDVDADAGLWEDGYYVGSGETILTTDSLQLDFEEPVVAGTGNVYIYTWNGILVQTIDAASLTTDPNDPSIIVVGKVDGLQSGEEYYVTMEPGAVVDLSGNAFAGIEEEDDWAFTVREDLVPDILRYSPIDENISTEADLMIEFDMPVDLGEGTVTIYLADGTLVQSLNVVDDAFDFNTIGNSVYIEIDDLSPATAYKVAVEAGAFVSSAGEASAAISADDWQFETEYNVEPTLVQLTPEDDSVDVPLDQIFVMEFDMDMQAGTGVLELHIHDGQNTLVTTIGATDDRVSISGQYVSVDLTGLTESDTEYYIIVNTDFVQNTTFTPESFAGIKKVFNWGFTTAVDESDLQVLAYQPNGTTIPDNHPNLAMIFNQPVSLSAQGGNVYVYKVGDTTPSLTIPLTSDMFENNEVNVSYDAAVTGGLDLNTDYYVLVDAEAIGNADGNSFDGVADPSVWTFTTGTDYALAADDQLAMSDDYAVYPNPFDDVIYISNSENISRLYITNVVGQRVKEVTNPNGMVSTSDLRDGIYIITLMLDDNVIASTQTIVKR
ncbi:Ig-like domain-containing protein [Mangrovibacterium marinum]|uniref:Putative secreted protein (Por secretion system target) n=1 Tax=Mangrovibacterium marinum TaxID=1639118 RepID=A0A2T5C5Z3_9BACT|nr:Ig-like domain-containing protein [Mangrovibacterium marinum]PTN10278.1 putative secreted protein (Por secretion system target) [Mangrovibacterium marinum]